MPMFEVWMEGYRITNGTVRAKKLGEAQADTFAEACERVLTSDWRFEAWRFFDRDNLTYFNRKLFTNAMDARRSCG